MDEAHGSSLRYDFEGVLLERLGPFGNKDLLLAKNWGNSTEHSKLDGSVHSTFSSNELSCLKARLLRLLQVTGDITCIV